MSEQKLVDGDYVLTEGQAWVRAKNFSIKLTETPDGVSVDIYKCNNETEEALASAYAFDVDAQGGA